MLVVTKAFPDNAIVAENPLKVVEYMKMKS